MSNFQSPLHNPENQKLAVLANSTLARSGAAQAAALRDLTGRTYVAINISSAELELDAVQSVYVVALASQISGIEGVVIAGERLAKTEIITENSPAAEIFYIDAQGTLSQI